MHLHSRALKYFDMIRRCGLIREAARRNRMMVCVSRAAGRLVLEL